MSALRSLAKTLVLSKPLSNPRTLLNSSQHLSTGTVTTTTYSSLTHPSFSRNPISIHTKMYLSLVSGDDHGGLSVSSHRGALHIMHIRGFSNRTNFYLDQKNEVAENEQPDASKEQRSRRRQRIVDDGENVAGRGDQYGMEIGKILMNDRSNANFMISQIKQVIDSIYLAGGTPAVRHYQGLAYACLKARKLDSFLVMLREMDFNAILPSTRIYNIGLCLCSREHTFEHAFQIFLKMKRDQVQPDKFTYFYLLESCSSSKTYVDQAKHIWLMMKEDAIIPDENIYAQIINCCTTRKDFEDGMLIYKEVSHTDSKFIKNSALRLCYTADNLEEAQKLVEEMKQKDLQIDSESYGAQLLFLLRTDRTEDAMQLLTNGTVSKMFRREALAEAASMAAISNPEVYKLILDLISPQKFTLEQARRILFGLQKRRSFSERDAFFESLSKENQESLQVLKSKMDSKDWEFDS